MIYLIEFALLHCLFLLVYKLMLAKETQLNFLRGFLLGSTLLALLIPAIDIPNAPAIPTINTEAIVLPTFNTLEPIETSDSLTWLGGLFLLVGSTIFIKMGFILIQIRKLYQQSSRKEIDLIPVREINGLQNSFTFFKWIFIDTAYFENPKDIVRHEHGHAQKLHTIDLAFFNMLTVIFWWVPSIWLMIKELRKIHEFEADQYAMSISTETYVKTLVHSTLKAHGMNLASSFDDAPIFNRLNFIKQMKKRMNPWKTVSIFTILAISTAMFACEDQLESEIKRIADESNQRIEYSADVSAALTELRAENPNQKYAVVETKIENEESINRLNDYDPEQIAGLFVSEEDGEKTIIMILSKASELFEKAIKSQKADENDVYTITEETASFPGGLDAYFEYIGSELNYPKQAQRLGVEGRVYVEFIIEPDGTISNTRVAKGIGAGCDAEALRVVQESPKWIPGKVNGEPVRQKMMQNIDFSLGK